MKAMPKITVKIGNKIYSSEEEPIMIITNYEERQLMAEQLKNMPEEYTKYCVYPDTPIWSANDYKGIKEWMNDYRIVLKV